MRWRRKAAEPPSAAEVDCRFLAGGGVTTARARRGERLYDVALRAGAPLQSACGGGGSCGRCLVEVVDGATAAIDEDLEALLLGGGGGRHHRLACLQRLAGPLTCRIGAGRDQKEAGTWCVVEGVEEISPSLRHVRLVTRERTLFAYRSGQHVEVGVGEPEPADAWRPYSIVEPSGGRADSQRFSLAVRVPARGSAAWGPGARLFGRARPGWRLLVSPPRGGLRPQGFAPAAEVWLLAGGVGIVPLAALVPELLARPEVARASLWHGCQDAAESAHFRARLKPWIDARRLTWLACGGAPAGDRRRGVERLLEALLARRTGGPASGRQGGLRVLACGRAGFVDCVRRLLASGAPETVVEAEHV